MGGGGGGGPQPYGGGIKYYGKKANRHQNYAFDENKILLFFVSTDMRHSQNNYVYFILRYLI
jgi:hypothetical protein